MSAGEALATQRLWLLPLTRPMIEGRLAAESFTLELATPDGARAVAFGPDWAGDLRGLFPLFLEALEHDPEAGFGAYALVSPGADGAPAEAVGDLGTKGDPTGEREVEIGYHLIPAARGRGLATEAVVALVERLLDTPGVEAVLAETLPENAPSERVLERAGFRRAGERIDPDDGTLHCWRRTA